MTYVRVQQCERLEKRDSTGVIAEITLGQHEGKWHFATGFQQRGGDCWASWSPLGFTEGRACGLDTREAALGAAIAHLRTSWAGRETAFAAQRAWLDGLLPRQADLFGHAA